MEKKPTILFTVDVEDWFQVENFRASIPFSSWSSYELRVEKNVHRLLDLLDEVSVQGSHRISEALVSPTSLARRSINAKAADLRPLSSGSVKATFFVLAWIAEKLPHLIREIYSRGHEVASHGYNHNLCKRQTASELKEDLGSSKKLLEDLLGTCVWGYRAPSFSVDEAIIKVIQDSGYLYDSSYNSFGLNSRYGQVDLSRYLKRGIASEISDSFYELPISNLQFSRFTLPWGGGGYLRLLPFVLLKHGIQWILRKEKAYLFYVHPWEFDPGQPRFTGASLSDRFRQYVNLSKAYSKLSTVFRNFNQCSFCTCYDYLGKVAIHGDGEANTRDL